jgi:multidrug efflux pump subunit AcrB
MVYPMKLSHLPIDHPWFAIVVSIFIVICGLLTIASLAIAQCPNVLTSHNSNRDTLPGASAESIARTVATPLEQEVNGVDILAQIEWTTLIELEAKKAIPIVE